MDRYNFWDLFQENADGSLTPKERIDVNGIEFGPGVHFQRGVIFGGINFHLFKNHDIAVEKNGSVAVIKGFYK